MEIVSRALMGAKVTGIPDAPLHYPQDSPPLFALELVVALADPGWSETWLGVDKAGDRWPLPSDCAGVTPEDRRDELMSKMRTDGVMSIAAAIAEVIAALNEVIHERKED